MSVSEKAVYAAFVLQNLSHSFSPFCWVGANNCLRAVAAVNRICRLQLRRKTYMQKIMSREVILNVCNCILISWPYCGTSFLILCCSLRSGCLLQASDIVTECTGWISLGRLRSHVITFKVCGTFWKRCILCSLRKIYIIYLNSLFYIYLIFYLFIFKLYCMLNSLSLPWSKERKWLKLWRVRQN